MFSSQYFANVINGWIDDIRYPDNPKGLYEPVAYMLAGGGKRLRPMLMLAVCEAMGKPCSDARSQALGIEMFHNFTLLHDDVMDNADVRHGRPTVHRQWNVPTAILSGDAMLTMASKYMGECDDVIRYRVTALFNDTAIEVYEGQQYDMNFETRDDVTEEEYLGMIRLKTAVLLACACRMGALIAGGDDHVQDAFYRYGIALGMAFQLRDDYLDSFGDEATFGKAIGGDILNDKKTWLNIKAWERDPVQMGVAKGVADPQEKIGAVIEVYRRYGIDTLCMELVDRYAAEALEAIAGLELADDAREFFSNLVLATAKRDR